MNSNKTRAALCFFVFLAACGPTGTTVTTTGPAEPPPASGGSCTTSNFTTSSFSSFGSSSGNQMSVTVNGSTCNGMNNYANEPCVSVTICSTKDPTNCQTINNILLDTGSYGLRVFSSLITVPLTPATSGNNALAECVTFGDGSSQWGPVEYAYVQLGNEPKVAVPIHVIDSSYAKAPAPCTSSESFPDTSPSQAGFNGILGVGLFAADCGPACETDENNGEYYSCNGSDCSCGATVASAAQVQNPVAALPVDNNGVLLALPAVGDSGASSVAGTLTIGIGTESNNALTGVTSYTANGYGEFSSLFSDYSSSYISSFIDSGSSILFFPAPTVSDGLTDCSASHGSSWTGLYCPSSNTALSATNKSATGVTGAVSFSIGNFYSLYTGGNKVFGNLGGSSGSSTYFDWGIPFFYGRSVYVGIEGKRTAPYWAY